METPNISGFRLFLYSVHNLRNSGGSNYKCEQFCSKLLSVALAGPREFRVDYSLHVIQFHILLHQ